MRAEWKPRTLDGSGLKSLANQRRKSTGVDDDGFGRWTALSADEDTFVVLETRWSSIVLIRRGTEDSVGRVRRYGNYSAGRGVSRFEDGVGEVLQDFDVLAEAALARQ